MINEPLSEYNKKRNFAQTDEPIGRPEEPAGLLRFVVQHHMARREHYDLRLEWNGVLLSWAVPKGPSYSTKDKRLAVQVEDHPLDYRNFEGTIPKGEYGGGTVLLWDEGSWEPIIDVDEGLKSGSLKFMLNGRRLKGKWALVRMKSKEGDTKHNWLLLKEKDAYANTENEVEGYTTSIRTGRSIAEIEAGTEDKVVKNPFSTAEIQLAKLVRSIPTGEDWLYELKYDGYRILAFIEGSSLRLITRNGNDYTHRFHSITAPLLDWAAGRAMVLDGEMVVLDQNGKTDFQALQNYMKNPKTQRLSYILFDLLALDGTDLREQPLTQRKDTLLSLMQDAPKSLHYSRHIAGNGKESFAAACGSGMEGIIGKKADSVYSGTRNGDWIKLKCEKRQELVIGGFTRTDKNTSGVSALLLGVYDKGHLVYAGRAGTGIGASEAGELTAQFQSLIRAEPPFQDPPKERLNEVITWLDPRLVAEVKFAEWTEENLLRQASYKGLRTDKDPKTIIRETADDVPSPPEEMEQAMETKGNQIIIEGVKISNPQKVLFTEPTITKEDVVRYYAEASKRMLPYISGRVLSVVRCPKGVSASCFFKKHPGSDSKGIRTIPIPAGDGTIEEYFYVDDVAGLVSEAQMGTLEFHIWGSRAQHLKNPDMLVFDLDPDEGMDLDTVRQGVRDMKSILTELSLSSYLKTSGGKGYHVVVPLQPAASWDVFHDFARGVAEVMEKKWPDRYTSNVRKVKRTNKIFIDWIRNGRGATSVAPYSLRARAGAPVSMPIAWEELDTVAPNAIDLKAALIRIGKDDPWKGFSESRQSIK